MDCCDSNSSRFFLNYFFIYNNFISFAITFSDSNWTTNLNRRVMEKKILEHIEKTIRHRTPKEEINEVLKLYGPMNYREYDKIINYIKKWDTGKIFGGKPQKK